MSRPSSVRRWYAPSALLRRCFAAGPCRPATPQGKVALALEPLEDRWMPSNVPIIVSSLADSGPGTLRQAITDANSQLGAHTIDLTGLRGTIALESVLPGLDTDLTIQGPGAATLTVQRDTAASPFRLFTIGSGATVGFSGLTLANGRGNNAGAIDNFAGTVTLSHCVLQDDAGTNDGIQPGEGGAVTNNTGSTLTVEDSTITGGGALARDGGGIYNLGTLTVEGSTLIDNSAAGDGGGLFNAGVATVENSTIYGNRAVGNGGGIFNEGGQLTLINDTIAANSANTPGGGGKGGGLLVNAGNVLLTNTLLAENVHTIPGLGVRLPDDVFGTVNSSSEGNLIADGSGITGIVGIRDNQLGLGGLIDAQLDTQLRDNGGPTPTLALLPASPAINTGTSTGATATDQGGEPRDSHPDIGAFEVDTASPTVTLNSSVPGVTNQSPIPVTVTFSEAVTDFTVHNLTTDNAGVTNFSGSGSTYTFDLVPLGQGTVTVAVAAGAAHDPAGNGNTASSTLSRTFASVAPTVTLTSSVQAETSLAPIPVTVTFSEPVTHFDVSKVTVSNGGITGFSGSGASYSFNLVPAGAGTVTASVAAGVADDSAGNGNLASAPYTATVTITVPAPPAPPVVVPLPAPPAAPAIQAALVKVKGRYMVRVTDGATGALKFILPVPRSSKGRPRLMLQDLNGDGILDVVLLIRQGRKLRRLGFSGLNGAPLSA
jgi:hypothetical protein